MDLVCAECIDERRQNEAALRHQEPGTDHFADKPITAAVTLLKGTALCGGHARYEFEFGSGGSETSV